MRRTITVRKSADGGTIEVRAGDRVLGQVSGLQGEDGGAMTGGFTHRPAFADFSAEFLQLSRAEGDGRRDEAAAVRAALEAAHVEIWHTAHDMRIDKPGTIAIAEGRVRFIPNDAFLMMRTGGLG